MYNSVFVGHSASWLPVLAATPLPATLPIFATGLGLGMSVLGWRRKQKREEPVAWALSRRRVCWNPFRPSLRLSLENRAAVLVETI
jgi:hypothetical protein